MFLIKSHYSSRKCSTHTHTRAFYLSFTVFISAWRNFHQLINKLGLLAPLCNLLINPYKTEILLFFLANNFPHSKNK